MKFPELSSQEGGYFSGHDDPNKIVIKVESEYYNNQLDRSQQFGLTQYREDADVTDFKMDQTIQSIEVAGKDGAALRSLMPEIRQQKHRNEHS